ncbi:MAG TPA: redoxin family protein [Anaerolineae bacterium]|nr:redoxin family protein [Anaerolineae bacterium]
MKKIVGLMVVFSLLLMACSGETSTGSEPVVEDTAVDTTVTGEEMGVDESGTGEEMGGEEMMVDESGTGEEMVAENSDMGEEMGGEEMMDGEMMDDEVVAEDEGMDEEMGMIEWAEWQTLSLKDAETGLPFSLADYEGKTVFVETMATWCSNCRRKLNNVRTAQAALADNEDVVFVALSLETNLSGGDLYRYAVDEGFGWQFAVMNRKMIQLLAAEFGQSVTNAPSTPHFIIRPDGSWTELHTGIDTADEIIAMVEAES